MRDVFDTFGHATTEQRLRTANRTVVTALACLVMLSAGLWGSQQAHTTLWRVILFLVFMLLPVALFSLLLAPESRFCVSGRWQELAVKALWLTLGAVALYAAGHQTTALIFESLVALCLPLAVAWDQI